MTRSIVPAVFALATLAAPALPQTAELDSNKPLFTVLAAINAVGHDAGLDSPSNHPLRNAVRAEIAKRNPAVLPRLKELFQRFRQEDAQWELRLYASYAVLTDGPPKFAWRLPEHQLPPDVAALKDLAPLLTEFHEQAGIEDLWERSQPALEQALARYQAPAIQAITEVSGYLRAPLSGSFMGRKFHVIVDLLGAPNQILSMAFLDDYYLIATNAPEPHVNDVRRQYMRYLLDPLFTRFGDKVDEKRAVGDYALGAPYLADHYKQDFLLLATTCLIRAIEARLAPAAGRDAMVDQAMKEGFVLTAHFAERLPVYEKQEQSMNLYFPELISSIDFVREEKRLEAFEFSQKRVIRVAPKVDPPPPPALSPVQKSLEEAETLYLKRDLDGARRAWLRAVEQTTEKALQGKSYYGLARIAVLRRDPETAEKLFIRALELGPPPADKAWTLVYLGRLAAAATEWEQARQFLETALGVEGASEKAREAATETLDQLKSQSKQQ